MKIKSIRVLVTKTISISDDCATETALNISRGEDRVTFTSFLLFSIEKRLNVFCLTFIAIKSHNHYGSMSILFSYIYWAIYLGKRRTRMRIVINVRVVSFAMYVSK